MHRYKLIINKAGNWQRIEGFHEQIVGRHVVLRQYLIPEVEMLGHLPALMIPAQQENRLGKIQFECVEKEDNLHRECASVDIVTKE
jgi:hypothetical protein